MKFYVIDFSIILHPLLYSCVQAIFFMLEKSINDEETIQFTKVQNFCITGKKAAKGISSFGLIICCQTVLWHILRTVLL